MDHTVTQYNANTWAISEGFVRVFLLEGRDKALLIDSGMNLRDLRSICAGLTDKPIELINTHGDPDHIGCNGEFDRFYLHPAEAVNYYGAQGGSGEMVPVQDGQVLDLGGREVEVILIPGHTPGSIALLDRSQRLLFGGDSVQDFVVFMFGAMRDLRAYQASMERLAAMQDRFDVVLASHGSLTVPPDIVSDLADYARTLRAGGGTYEVADLHGRAVRKYTFPRCGFYRADE